MTDSYSTRTPQQALAALLERYAPQSLLLVGNSPLPALEAFAAAHPQSQVVQVPAGPLPAEQAAHRFDLAVLADCLEHLPKRTGLQLLGGIRNLNASTPAAGRTPTSSPWPCRPMNASVATSRP
jgi:hypothetical protein